MNIPTIPGLQPHPVQVAEQQRIAALRAQGAPTPGAPADAQKPSSSLMPEQTRDLLKQISQSFRKAAGLPEPPPDTKPPPASGTPGPGKRAEGQTRSVPP